MSVELQDPFSGSDRAAQGSDRKGEGKGVEELFGRVHASAIVSETESETLESLCRGPYENRSTVDWQM